MDGMQAHMGALKELEAAAERELEGRGKVEFLHLHYVLLPGMHHPISVPHRLVLLVDKIASRFGWEVTYSHVVVVSGHHGYFSFMLEKRGSPALPAWAFVALVGLVVAGVVIVAVEIRKMVVATNIRKIYESCIGAGGSPEECGQVVREAREIVARAGAGGLGLLALAFVAGLLLSQRR